MPDPAPARLRSSSGAAGRSAASGPLRGSPGEKELVIRWRKSTIGEKQGARRTLFALGLRRMNQRVVHPDSPALRGMVARVRHLVDVEEREPPRSSLRSSGGPG